MNNTTDVIIIGGGVQGASLAFHLAERGARSILLEKKFVGAALQGVPAGWCGCTMTPKWTRVWCGPPFRPSVLARRVGGRCGLHADGLYSDRCRGQDR